jgi:hypothetical protein
LFKRVAETGPQLANVLGKGRLGLADFRGLGVCDVFASRSPLRKLLTLTPEKSHLKCFSDFGKKIYKVKPALPNNFALGSKGVWEVFGHFVFLWFS